MQVPAWQESPAYALQNPQGMSFIALFVPHRWFILSLLFSLLLLLTLSSGATSQDAGVPRGERPPIDLTAVPDDAWEPGVIRIQFAQRHTSWLDAHHPGTDDGRVAFGIAAVDALNDRYGVREASAIFDSPALDQRYAERHRKWGFHLWYNLVVPDTTDVIAMVKAYQQLEDVRVAEPHYRKVIHGEVLGPEGAMADEGEMMPDDPFFHNQWHYHNTGQANGTPGADISLPQAWEINTGADEVIVAVIDGGILTTHPDLEESIWDGVGYNFAMDTESIVPNHHGTHVGGTIAARSNNGLGVAGIAGGWGDATGAKLMSLQVFSNQGNGGFELAPVFAADNGAAVSQNSWGYQTPNVYEQVILDAIDYFNAHGGGEVMDGGITTTSAGNSGDNDAYYPGYYPGAMAVASTNNQDQKAGYSNYGGFIEISAPGGETSPLNAGGVYSTTIANSYNFGQGTSMACPHVSGVIVLMLSLAPGEFTNDEIRDMLKAGADNHYGANPGYIGLLGAGRLNAHQALVITLENMAGVSDFEAEVVHNHRADLSWVPNREEEPVMLVWNALEVTAELEWDLQPGDTLEDGSKVLYKGFGQAFSHKMPAHAPEHHYAIRSYNPADEEFSRSSALKVQREASLAVLPFEEVFEYPWWPPGWDSLLVSPGEEATGVDPELELVDLADHPDLQPAAGQHAVRFNASEAREGAASRLVSTPLSTQGLQQVALEVAYYLEDAFAEHGHRLALQISLDQEGWTTIAELLDEEGGEGWQTASLSIPNHFVNRDTIYLGFLFESGGTAAGQTGDLFFDHLDLQAGPDEWVVDFLGSSQEVQAGESVLFTSQTAGLDNAEKQWHFGESAMPAQAEGKGPHEVVYREPGEKTVSLVVNDSLEMVRADYITVLASPYPAPEELEAAVFDDSAIQLTWSFPETPGSRGHHGGDRGDQQDQPDGFNLYRNGHFHENIPDAEAFTFVDEAVPEGWLTYTIKAYFTHPHQESPPAEAVTLAINETEVHIGVEGSGTTDPEPGMHVVLANDSLRVEAFPEENHGFVHWLVEGESPVDDNPAHLFIAGATDIVAVFQDETDVVELDAGPSFAVYPNPTQGPFIVTAKERMKRLELVDLDGQVLYRDQPMATQMAVNPGDLSPGVYLLRVLTETGTGTRRLVVQ